MNSPRLMFRSFGSEKIVGLSFIALFVVATALRFMRLDETPRIYPDEASHLDVAYSLLPPEFTLSQLQQSYEAILGRELDKRNFRKRLTSLGIVEATGRYESEGRHRPAQLYRFLERRPVVV